MEKEKIGRNASIVALRFPDGVSKRISEATKGVPGALKMGDHHVTMAYLGDDEMDDETRGRVRKAVKMFAASTPPLEGGTFDGTGSFKMGPHGVPFYANVKMAGLDTMHSGLRGALDKEGIKMTGAHADEKQTFVPHATLAYLPEGEKPPELDVEQNGLKFGALHLKMGGGEYEEFPLTGEAKAYDMSGHVDAVHSAWRAKMIDRYGGDEWYDKGYTIDRVEDDAIITKKGGVSYRCPYTIDDGRVRFGEEMQPGALTFIPAGEPSEYKMCSPGHAKKMYMKMCEEKGDNDNRVLDVADGNIIYEKAGKRFSTAYSGEGDDVKFGKPVPVEMDDDKEETKAGRRMAAPNVAKLAGIKDSLADAVAKINQFLQWNQYMEGTDKSFPDWLDLDMLAEWMAPAAALKGIDIPPMYLKAVSETDKGVVAGGYMAPWGAPARRDLELDFFRPETNFFLEHYPKAPAIFHHGKDPIIGKSVLGHRDEAHTDDVGLWVQDWLDKSNKFWPMVKALLERRALYYSPGAAPHLVERDENRQLKSYPIVDDTFTVTPMQAPLMMGRSIEYIKSAYAEAGCELTFPAGFGEGAGSAPMNANGQSSEQELALAMLDLRQRAMEAL